MSGLAERLRGEVVRYLVSRAITCPRTGEVLDVRTCVVLTDRDGEPVHVMSQAGWRDVTASTTDVETLRKVGITPDKSTVKDDLCLADFGGYGACVKFPKHQGKHRDALGHQWGSA